MYLCMYDFVALSTRPLTSCVLTDFRSGDEAECAKFASADHGSAGWDWRPGTSSQARIDERVEQRGRCMRGRCAVQSEMGTPMQLLWFVPHQSASEVHAIVRQIVLRIHSLPTLTCNLAAHVVNAGFRQSSNSAYT